MKRLDYKQVEVTEQTNQQVEDLITLKFVGDLYRESGRLCTPDPRIYNTMKILQSSLRVLFSLDQQPPHPILDLGCGANGKTEESRKYKHGQYEPWLCRALHKLGKQVIGIDIGDLSEEKFPYIETSLLDPHSLDSIRDNSIYIAHANMLFNSPELERQATGKRVENATSTSRKALEQVLLPQLDRILVPEGIFLVSPYN